MSDVWYYAKGDRTVGPFTLAELAMYLSSSADILNVLVWRDGFAEWRRASEVTELSRHLIRPPNIPRIPLGLSAEFVVPKDVDRVEQKKPLFRRVLGPLLLIGLLAFVAYAREGERREDQAEQEYYKAHPLTELQKAANKHFSTCYQYRHASTSIWSENQRNTMLFGEACYSDDRDDPRYDDATYPWNANAPHPWEK